MNDSILNLNVITSKANSTIVKIGKLLSKKYRETEKLFICNGVKLFIEAVTYNAKIRYIVIDNFVSFDTEIIDKIKQLKASGTTVLCVTSDVFSKLSEEQAPQGIITICEYFDEKHTFSTLAENNYSKEKIIALESVRDPGNVGTIIRNAVAFGFDRMIISSDCADVYSPKVIRAAMGAVFKINICVVENLKEALLKLKSSNKSILGAALNKNSLVLGKETLSQKDVIVIGNEGHGLSDEILSVCDDTVFIPMSKNTESLNAAMAATIIMWEISKNYNI